MSRSSSSQNPFCVSRRLVTLEIGCVYTAWFGLYIASSDPSPHAHHHTLDSHTLLPRNYLNNSAVDPAPFEFCPVFGPGDAIAERRGQLELLKSRLHLGSGARVQRVLQKAMSGAPVTISVLGGSSEFTLFFVSAIDPRNASTTV